MTSTEHIRYKHKICINNEKYVDAFLDAPDNDISVNEPSSEMLTSQCQIPERGKIGNAKE